MKKKLIALILCCATALTCLAGCGGGTTSTPAPSETTSTAPADTSTPAATTEPSGEPVYGGTLKVALNRTISAKSLDPLYIDSTTADQVAQNFGDTLVRENFDQSEYLPNIATEWTVSEDGKTYTFTIRDDVYFHPGTFQDGRKMTAEDVAYSVNRAKDYWCNYLFFLDYAEATDDTTVVCHLLDANATFLHELTSSSVIMVPQEEVEGWGEEFGMHMVSTGPFMVEEHVPDQYTRLVKNPNYWGVEPYLDGVTYYIITDEAQALNALTTGEIDVSLNVTGESITQVRSNADLTLAQNAEPRVAYLGFNLSDPILSDAKVRQALAMCIDRTQIEAGVYANGDGQASYLPVPLMSWGYDAELEALAPAYDPEGAKALLTEAGYPNGFKLALTVGTAEAYVRAATIIQAMWSQIGVEVDIQSLSATEVTDRYINNTVQVWISGQGGSSDPATFVGYFLNTEKMHTNYNAFCYSDPATDALIAQGLAETDQAVREEIYKQLVTEAMETNIGVFFATTNLSWGFRNNVHGYVQENKAVMRICGTEGTGINIWIEP